MTTPRRSATAERGTVRRHGDRPARKAGPARSERLTAVTAGGVGLRHIAELTTKEAEGITSVEPQDDGWLINVEVVEDRRIPSSGDILAIYQVKIDKEGGLQSYRRIRRYRRSNGDNGEAF
ncbi:gas vesicle protein GvpO [Nonomuraea sp. NPDC050404]|uniref:gas vesicle protein GvpO n=1 Tax=Nonomuraea sp. NPDC050404 TaxID=3155783 RepID=UPI0033D50F0B